MCCFPKDFVHNCRDFFLGSHSDYGLTNEDGWDQKTNNMIGKI